MLSDIRPTRHVLKNLYLVYIERHDDDDENDYEWDIMCYAVQKNFHHLSHAILDLRCSSLFQRNDLRPNSTKEDIVSAYGPLIDAEELIPRKNMTVLLRVKKTNRGSSPIPCDAKYPTPFPTLWDHNTGQISVLFKQGEIKTIWDKLIASRAESADN